MSKQRDNDSILNKKSGSRVSTICDLRFGRAKIEIFYVISKKKEKWCQCLDCCGGKSGKSSRDIKSS